MPPEVLAGGAVLPPGRTADSDRPSISLSIVNDHSGSLSNPRSEGDLAFSVFRRGAEEPAAGVSKCGG
jgi:hypothetical protein